MCTHELFVGELFVGSGYYCTFVPRHAKQELLLASLIQLRVSLTEDLHHLQRAEWHIRITPGGKGLILDRMFNKIPDVWSTALWPD